MKRICLYPQSRRGTGSFFLCAMALVLLISSTAVAQWDSVVVMTNDDYNYFLFNQIIVDDSFRLHVFAKRSVEPNSYQPTQLIYQRFDNWGNPITEQIEIEPDGQRDDQGLAVLLGRNGWIHVVWNRIYDTPNPFESRWMYMRMGSNGEMLTPPLQLDTNGEEFWINQGVRMVQDGEGVIWIAFQESLVMAINEFGEVVDPLHRVLPDPTERLLSMLLQRSPTDEIWACGRHVGDGNEDILLVRLDTAAFVAEEVMEITAPPPAAIGASAFHIDSAGSYHYIIYVEAEGEFFIRDQRDGSGLDSVHIAPSASALWNFTDFVLLNPDTLQFINYTAPDRSIIRTLISHIDPEIGIEVQQYPINQLFGHNICTICSERSGSLWMPGFYRVDHNEPLQLAMTHVPGPNEPPPQSATPQYPVASDYNLVNAYPNPFNATTTILFDIASPQYVQLTVYDILGKEVGMLVNNLLPQGKHSVAFDAAGLPSGIYLYRLEAGSRSETKKMVLLR